MPSARAAGAKRTPAVALPSHRAASLRDVAELSGVSDATASRVLRNSRNVGVELRQRVIAAAAKLNYQPNPHARALASSRDTSVGVVVHDVSDPYFSEIVRGALEAAEKSGRMLFICNTYRDAERELAYIRHFRAQRVDALLLAGSGEGEVGERIAKEILEFKRGGGRAALMGHYQATGDAVMSDNIDGGRQMANHLVDLGHRRIGVIAGPAGLTASRLAGFRDQLAKLGVDLNDDQIREGDFTRDGGRAATTDLLDSVVGLTAIFALNDVMAIGALTILRERKLRVPRDVSVAGFDDIPVAQDLQPPLTTIRVPMAEMGRLAVTVALGPPGGSTQLGRLPTALVVRESTGTAKSSPVRSAPARKRRATTQRPTKSA
jgi:LacI family transcriptional regulator